MDKFPLLLEGRPAGELTAERERLYTCLTARCPLPEGLWCAWAVGERGELRLGVLEPQGGCGVIRRRFSDRLTAPLGRILRGEVRPREAEMDAAPDDGFRPAAENWTPVPAPESLFRTPWLRQRLKGLQGVLACTAGDVRRLALPWNPRHPFPLTPLFCFAGLQSIGEGLYAVLSFDQGEQPVFWEM